MNITPVYAALLGIIYFCLSLMVIGARRRHQISLGSGEQNQILGEVSAHHNFASYVPIVLILSFFVESASLLPDWGLHVINSVFFVGRVLHIVALCRSRGNLRVMGMQATLWPMVIFSSIILLNKLGLI